MLKKVSNEMRNELQLLELALTRWKLTKEKENKSSLKGLCNLFQSMYVEELIKYDEKENLTKIIYEHKPLICYGTTGYFWRQNLYQERESFLTYIINTKKRIINSIK